MIEFVLKFRVHPDDYQNVKTLFDSSRTRRIECEFRFIPTKAELAAGVTEKWVEATVGPVRDETGTVVMVAGTHLGLNLHADSQGRYSMSLCAETIS
jgi:hypothetical protein